MKITLNSIDLNSQPGMLLRPHHPGDRDGALEEIRGHVLVGEVGHVAVSVALDLGVGPCASHLSREVVHAQLEVVLEALGRVRHELLGLLARVLKQGKR